MNESIESRMARVEEQTGMIPEMREDLKSVLAYVNQQKGRASVSHMVWTSIISLVAAAIGALWGSHK